MEGEYVFEEKQQKVRYIVSNATDQDIPTAPMRVIKVENSPNKSGKGTHPRMTLEDDEGNKYFYVAWTRDVSKCVSQYGEKASQWDEVAFSVENGNVKLVPSPMRVTTERV